MRNGIQNDILIAQTRVKQNSGSFARKIENREFNDCGFDIFYDVSCWWSRYALMLSPNFQVRHQLHYSISYTWTSKRWILKKRFCSERFNSICVFLQIRIVLSLWKKSWNVS